MYYYLYKITNNINNKFYIGFHKTKNLNDGYMGSGKIIRQAIKKYGKDNFTKEILEFFDNVEDMHLKEKEVVNDELLNHTLCYNLRLGGDGGFDYIIKNGLNHTPESKLKFSKSMKKWHSEHDTSGINGTFYGKKHSEKTKEKISIAHKQRFIEGEPHPRGMLGKKHTKETKNKQSKNSKKTLLGKTGENHPAGNTKWYNNGIKHIRSKTHPGEGWVEGRIFKNRKKRR